MTVDIVSYVSAWWKSEGGVNVKRNSNECARAAEQKTALADVRREEPGIIALPLPPPLRQ